MCSLGRKMRRAMLYLEHQIDTPVPSAFLHLWGVMCVRSPDIRFIQLIAINIVLKLSSQSKKFDVRICWNYGMQLRACIFLFLDSGWYISVYVIWERAFHMKSKWPTECLLLSARYRYHPNELWCKSRIGCNRFANCTSMKVLWEPWCLTEVWRSD